MLFLRTCTISLPVDNTFLFFSAEQKFVNKWLPYRKAGCISGPEKDSLIFGRFYVLSLLVLKRDYTTFIGRSRETFVSLNRIISIVFVAIIMFSDCGWSRMPPDIDMRIY